MTEEEIAQVYQHDHQLSWGILAAIDKLAYNFDDLSQMEKYLNQTYDLVKRNFVFERLATAESCLILLIPISVPISIITKPFTKSSRTALNNVVRCWPV
ncbi:hypothetical protein [Brevibacillus thermoruber]|uniref:hypothetical protein n=1 Tax=Brevibacillus thermoruber TaxID=33942 RepID=UPI0005502C47|nr:hypothetical protein [Brevibacillus thermoruber]